MRNRPRTVTGDSHPDQQATARLPRIFNCSLHFMALFPSRISRRYALGTLGSLTGTLMGGFTSTLISEVASAAGATDTVIDADPWVRSRAQLVLNPRLAWFDTARFGPSSRAVLAAVYRAEEALHTDPAGFYASRYSAAAVSQFSQRLGGWLGCTADELCFTRDVASGLKCAAQALLLQAGDEVVVNAQLPAELHEYWQQQAAQRGLIIKTVQLATPLRSTAEVLEAFEAALTERSRVLICTHMQPLDGAVLPVRELCQLARSRNMISMIDGSLMLGALQFSVRDLDCDIYGSSLCHWLNGAQHTAVLFVRSELQTLLGDALNPGGGTHDPAATLSRNWPRLCRRWPHEFIEQATQFQSISSAMNWQENLGRARIEARLRELQTYARLRLQGITGIELLTPAVPGMWLHILSLRPARGSAAELANWLQNNDKVIVSGLTDTQDAVNVLRISLHTYNSHDEIERLVQGLQRALRA